MSPATIATIRAQAEALEAQAAALSSEQPTAAAQLRASVGELYRAIAPYCWGCGAVLTPIDPADHLCLNCIGSAPLSFPN